MGRHLLADLLRAGLPTAALIRDSQTHTASERIDALLAEIEQSTGRLLPRPVVLAGDVNAAGFGLDRDGVDFLRTRVARVIHSAASLSFKPAETHPENEPYRTNVDGTRNLLAVLDEAGIGELHAISTAYVCGLSEGTIAEAIGPQPQAFANDYERSKWQAEQILADAGLPSLTITRPSIVIDSHDRAARSDRTIYSTLATLKMLMNQFGPGEASDWTSLLGLDGSERKNVIEATWAARVIVEIVRHRSRHGGVTHITAPRGTSIGEMTEAFHAALVEAGESRRPDADAGTSGPPPLKQSKPKQSNLKQSNPMLDAMAAGFVQTFAPYFRDDPTFAHDRLDAAIDATTAAAPPTIDRETMRALAERMLAAEADPAEATEPTPPVLDADRLAGPPAADAIGLVIAGPGGGDWSIADGRVAIGGGYDAPMRLFTRVDVWPDLAAGGRLTDAAARLDASVECDDTDAAAAADRIEQAIAEALSPAAASEASHVSV